MEYVSRSVRETEDLGAKLAGCLKGTKTFVALYGDLGAGKTAFVRGFASVIAPEAEVSSPSYALVNEYGYEGGTLYHMDVYRVRDEEDLYSFGYYDYDGPMIVEWCERIPYALPADRVEVRIDIVDEQTRIIRIEARGSANLPEGMK